MTSDLETLPGASAPALRLGADHELSPGTLSKGTTVGRYLVLECLGMGGMGVVYAAYDPQLDRKIALKLVRPLAHDMPNVHARLLREAKAMARLSHPNVVTVHDVGTVGEQVFVAMELIDGVSLRAWLSVAPRTWREMREVVVAAGRGLQAAHTQGLVHRDFKPDNVMIDRDGRVVVMDFGLARALAEGEEPAPIPGSVEPETSIAMALTEAGRIVGTPGYMAPEQFDGRTVDARSDQFGFCVTLYEALYGERPFAGETVLELAASVVSGRVRAEPRGTVVPRWMRVVILRGLAASPHDRYPSMEELLAELEPPRRRWGGVAVGLTLLAGLGVGATIVHGGPRPCSDPVAALGGAWGPEPRARLEAAMQARGVEAELPRVASRLDAYADAWVAMYDESCRATFVDRHQSELSFDQRLRCLERRRNRLRSTVDALVGAADGQELVQRTILAWQLPPLRECADLEAVASETLPDDPALRARIASLRERIDEADTRHDVGDFAGGLVLAREASDEARALGYAPLHAEALGSLGRLLAAAGEAEAAQVTLAEALALAAAAGDDRRVATAWTWLVFARGLAQHDGETEVLALAARTAVERAGDPTIRGWLLNNLGVLDGKLGRLDAAIEHLRAALAVKLELLGEDHVDVAISRFNLGNALVERGAWAQARPELVRAREVFQATVGERHPMTHYAHKGLCRTELGAGRVAAAIGPCEAALAGFEAAPARWIAGVELLLARALWGTGQRPRALEVARSAREHAEQDEALVATVDAWLADPDGFDGPP